MSNELTDAIVGMREDEALAMVARDLDAGVAPIVVLDQAKEAMRVGPALRVRRRLHSRAHHGR